MTHTAVAARNLVRLRRMEGQVRRLCNDMTPLSGGSNAWYSMTLAVDHLQRAMLRAIAELPRAMDRDERVAAAILPEGWKAHPSASGYFYKGQEILAEADLLARMTKVHPLRPQPVPSFAQ